MAAAIFRSNDGQVVKAVHDDGSESAVKTVKSVDGRVGLDGAIHFTEEDRGKYSLFLSASTGCVMRCGFCHLTMKKAAYTALTGEQILANAKEAVLAAAQRDPSLAARYAKICWMGMGEDALRFPERTRALTHALARWLLEQGLAAGIDGVDLSTVLPRTNSDWAGQFAALDAELDAYLANPATPGRDTGRSRFRLFFSVHSAVQATRDELVPGAQPLTAALAQVAAFRAGGARTLVLHHLLFEDVNDTQAEVDALAAALAAYDLAGVEVRLLRYNGCGRSALTESPRFEQVAARLSALTSVKVQTSLGTEVKAACGQFIVRDFDEGAEIAEIGAASAAMLAAARRS